MRKYNPNQFLFFGYFFCMTNFYSQSLRLNSALKEISGLEVVNDTIFVAINDSGNEPIVFYLNKKGKITHQLFLKNAKNGLSFDPGNCHS